MEDDTETDAHDAAQGLLDFAQMATGGRHQFRPALTSETAKASVSASEPAPSSTLAAPQPLQRLAVATCTSPGHGRLITSGNLLASSRSGKDFTPQKTTEAPKKGAFKQPAPRRPETQDRVTVIVQKSGAKEEHSGKGTEVAELPVGTSDMPVPASAFASLIGSGDSGKSSTDFTPFAATVAVRDQSSSDTESEEKRGDPQGDAAEDNSRPVKKARMNRTVSINTVLQRVGSKEAPLADAVGCPPQTVQEMIRHIPGPAKPRSEGSRRPEAPVDTLQIVEKLWGPGLAPPSAPSLPPRKSSDQSTIDAYRQLAHAEAGHANNADLLTHTAGTGFKRELSQEAALHLPQKLPLANTTGPRSTAVESGIASAVSGATLTTAAVQDAADEVQRSVLWQGRIKHSLRTADGSSVVELFDLTALVPEKLVEQIPPTIFVSALAGRANVKLGKHYVTRCHLTSLSERQRQKGLALAAMKLVAICELQHCSLTLVPLTNDRQELRIVGFMIADE